MVYEVTIQAGDIQFSATSTWPQREIGKATPDRLVLLLHGFPDDRSTWDSLFTSLSESLGSQSLIVAPSLRGYEPSTAGMPDSKYSLVSLAEDVSGWIDTLSLGAPAYIVGHDWGSLIAFKAASLYPTRIKAIFTLAVPYMATIPIWRLAIQFPEQVWRSSYFVTMHIARLYRPRLSDAKSRYLRGLWQYWSPTWQFTEHELNHVAHTLAQPGVADAVTAYYRNLPWTNSGYGIVNTEDVPVFQLAGGNDGCMSPRLYEFQDHLWAGNTNVKVKILPGTGHFIHREAPSEVSKLIIDFIHEH